jgi:hypothetical protein
VFFDGELEGFEQGAAQFSDDGDDDLGSGDDSGEQYL